MVAIDPTILIITFTVNSLNWCEQLLLKKPDSRYFRVGGHTVSAAITQLLL